MSRGTDAITDECGDRSGESVVNDSENIDFDGAKQQIRGSALLFAGRPIALVLNLLAQVLTVRYLSKLDFGAFIFAFSIMETSIVVAGFGMDKAIARFASIYDSQRQQQRLAGVIGAALIAVTGIGLAVVVLAYGLAPLVSRTGTVSPLATSLLLTLILLAPIKALDNVHESLASVFAGVRLVFLRRVFLVPALRLIAVVAVIMTSGDVYALAVSHVVAGVVGALLYGILLWRLLLQRNILRGLSQGAVVEFGSQFVRYSAILFSSDLVLLIRGLAIVVLLEVLHSTTSVAEYRAVLPLARLNELVVVSFSVLFIPIASKVFSSQNAKELNELYWQTACWITVFTFPLFALTYAVAGPLVVMLFGPEYADSGRVLALIAIAYYFNSALGFNSRMLKVVGKVWHILGVDLFALAFSMGMYFWAIPRYGALGAAAAVSVSTVVHAIAKQAALLRWTDVKLCSWRYAKVYAAATAATVVLTLWQALFTPSLVSGVALIAVCWLGIIVAGREALAVNQIFPELQRVRFLRRWIHTG